MQELASIDGCMTQKKMLPMLHAIHTLLCSLSCVYCLQKCWICSLDRTLTAIYRMLNNQSIACWPVSVFCTAHCAHIGMWCHLPVTLYLAVFTAHYELFGMLCLLPATVQCLLHTVHILVCIFYCAVSTARKLLGIYVMSLTNHCTVFYRTLCTFWYGMFFTSQCVPWVVYCTLCTFCYVMFPTKLKSRNEVIHKMLKPDAPVWCQHKRVHSMALPFNQAKWQCHFGQGQRLHFLY